MIETELCLDRATTGLIRGMAESQKNDKRRDAMALHHSEFARWLQSIELRF